jgi:hypothetical protein
VTTLTTDVEAGDSAEQRNAETDGGVCGHQVFGSDVLNGFADCSDPAAKVSRADQADDPTAIDNRCLIESPGGHSARRQVRTISCHESERLADRNL